MKTILTLIISLLSSFSLYAQTVTEYFNIGNPIEYSGTNFYLAWSTRPLENYIIQEYLPHGESFEHFNQMFTVSILLCDRTPFEAVESKIEELKQRQQTDPIIRYTASEKDGEYILEFIVSDYNNGNINTVEFNVHHYKQMNIDGKKAVVLSFYSCRGYGDNITAFIQSIPDKRDTWREDIGKLKLSPIFSKE